MIMNLRNLISKSEDNMIIFMFINYFYIIKFMILDTVNKISYIIYCDLRDPLMQKNSIYIFSLCLYIFFSHFNILDSI